MTSPSPFDDESRFTLNTIRWLREDVATQLWRRGWTVTDPDIGDDQPLEWFWPPTAPIDYGGRPEHNDKTTAHRPQFLSPRRTPWTLPTRITRTGQGWRLAYGATRAQKPRACQEYADGAALIDNLERIECWPLSVAETHAIRAQRIVNVVTAMAHDQHYLAMPLTEPYVSRLSAIREHQHDAHDRTPAHPGTQPSSPPRQPGDLSAQQLLVDAEAFASAVRTERAGGKGRESNDL